MTIQPRRYINPLLDYGFKKLFGQDSNKRFLIAFLNELLPGDKQIADLKYGNPEHQGESQNKRIVIFDVLCHGKDGEVFLIEVQQIKQHLLDGVECMKLKLISVFCFLLKLSKMEFF